MKVNGYNGFKIILIGAGGTGGYIAPHLYRIAFASGYALTLTHVHFVDDICDYFSITRDIKELNSDERTMEEVINETEMLTLDEVFDKYIVKYLQKKIIKEKEFKL